MGIALNASAVPAIQQPAAFKSITDAYTAGASATALNSYLIPDATPTNLSGPFNANGVRTDLVSRYGGGNAYAILTGLVISTVASLSLPVTKGHARIDGITEVNADTTLAVPDATARIYVWLSQAGVLSYTTTVTPPAGAQCFLGSCVTSGGAVTSVDTSGVCFVYGGIMYRQSADNGMPTDGPPSNVVFLHKTAFNTYLWTGVSYLPEAMPSVTTDPGNPQNGDVWYRTDLNQQSIFVGGATVRIGSSTPSPITTSSATLITQDGSAHTIVSYTVPQDTSVQIRAHVIGVKSDDSKGAMYELVAEYRRSGSTVTAIAGPASPTLSSLADDASYNGAFNVSGTDIQIQVTGKSGEFLKWNCVLEVVSIQADPMVTPAQTVTQMNPMRRPLWRPQPEAMVKPLIFS